MQGQGTRGDPEGAGHVPPVDVPTPNMASFPYDPGGDSMVGRTEHENPTARRTYSLISQSPVSQKQVLGSQNDDMASVSSCVGLGMVLTMD